MEMKLAIIIGIYSLTSYIYFMIEHFEFAPKYVVTVDGDIISMNYKYSGFPRKLKYNRYGPYLMVNIKGKLRTIHRIVAEAFIPNPENKPHVNHKDGNKHNNKAYNLEWVTRSENQLHAYRVLGVKNFKSNLGNFYGESFRARPVIQLSRYGLILHKFDCVRRAQHELGISETAISNCLNGRSKTAGGFIWEYA